MKRLVLVLMVAAALGILLYAAAAPSDVIDYQAKPGKVAFTHKKHADALKDCAKCHPGGKGAKIEGFSKDVAHSKLCKPCHVTMKKGPTACNGCHVK